MGMEINEMIEKRDQLNARIQLIEARTSHQKRKEDTRKKIIVGALILDKHEKEGTLNELLAWLETKLNRNLDRKLFGFQPQEQKN